MAETHPKFDVALVTPEGETFRGEAEMLIVPGAAGEIGVLARHAPLVATLKAGSTVPLKETIEAFKKICEGEYDQFPEQAFFMCGGLEDLEKNAHELMKG